MSYGINILQANGQRFDDSVAGLTLMDVISVGADTVGSLSFPALAGRNIVVARASASATAFGMHSAAITYPGGVPTIYYAPTGGPSPHTATQLMVFAR